MISTCSTVNDFTVSYMYVHVEGQLFISGNISVQVYQCVCLWLYRKWLTSDIIHEECLLNLFRVFSSHLKGLRTGTLDGCKWKVSWIYLYRHILYIHLNSVMFQNWVHVHVPVPEPWPTDTLYVHVALFGVQCAILHLYTLSLTKWLFARPCDF